MSKANFFNNEIDKILDGIKTRKDKLNVSLTDTEIRLDLLEMSMDSMEKERKIFEEVMKNQARCCGVYR